MRAVIYAQTIADLEFACGLQAEVILAPKLLSRRGSLTMSEARQLAEAAQKLSVTAILEWDALMTEAQFRQLTQELTQHPFKVIRVRDAGAAWWLKEHHPQVALQLLLEAGHHNLVALQSWIMRLGAQLTRICLSPELPADVIKGMRSHLGIELEVLGLGPLLLFHSGRALLSSLESAPEGLELEAEGASEESPHKGFLLRENSHGTLMFHPKDLGLLERWSELEDAGVDVVRIDDRDQSSSVRTALAHFLRDPSLARAQELKGQWSREWMRGYFDVNKSDVLFPKLKNPHLRQQDGKTVGVVLEGKREGWLAVQAKGAGLSVGQMITAIDPKGQAREEAIHWIKDSGFRPIEKLAPGEVGFIAWFAGAPTQTVLLS